MRDGPLRRSVKALALGWFFAALGLDRLLARATRRAPFVLAGDCQQCSACCEAPAIRVSFLTWNVPALRQLFLWWQDRVNGFTLRTRAPGDAEAEDGIFVFKCSHFDWVNRRCDSYSSRPGMCRDYPRALLYQPHPELLPGCGYRPLARNAKRFLRVLDAQPMTDEQRARLKKDLFLE
jgi:hypothetical protein